MDYKDYQSSVADDYFWFRGKEAFIHILLASLPRRCGAKILNIGAGTGNDAEVISRFGDVWALDLNPAALDLIPPTTVKEKKVGSAYDTGYANDFFDIVVAFDVLEHLEDDARAVKEISRILKPGGYFVVTVPAFPFLFGPHDVAYEHYRRYTKPMMTTLLEHFERITLGYWLCFLFFPAVAARLLDKFVRRPIGGSRLPDFLNNLFYRILSLENRLINRGLEMPVGLSLYGVYRQPKPAGQQANLARR